VPSCAVPVAVDETVAGALAVDETLAVEETLAGALAVDETLAWAASLDSTAVDGGV
jgi:hypothetical protein